MTAEGSINDVLVFHPLITSPLAVAPDFYFFSPDKKYPADETNWIFLPNGGKISFFYCSMVFGLLFLAPSFPHRHLSFALSLLRAELFLAPAGAQRCSAKVWECTEGILAWEEPSALPGSGRPWKWGLLPVVGMLKSLIHGGIPGQSWARWLSHSSSSMDLFCFSLLRQSSIRVCWDFVWLSSWKQS